MQTNQIIELAFFINIWSEVKFQGSYYILIYSSQGLSYYQPCCQETLNKVTESVTEWSLYPLTTCLTAHPISAFSLPPSWKVNRIVPGVCVCVLRTWVWTSSELSDAIFRLFSIDDSLLALLRSVLERTFYVLFLACLFNVMTPILLNMLTLQNLHFDSVFLRLYKPTT